MSLRDHYRILGVSPRAEWEEIRRRFRILVRRYHPDRNATDSEAATRFRRVVEAYEAVQQARVREPFRHGRHDSCYLRRGVRVSPEVFADYFGLARPEEASGRRSGPDFRYDLRISFAAAFLGTDLEIRVPHFRPCQACQSTGRGGEAGGGLCPDCRGTGRRPLGPGLLRMGAVCRSCQGLGRVIIQPCPHCQGNGFLLQDRSYQVRIPAGTKDGARFRIPGEGGDGFHHGPPGNLNVVISVEPHAYFTRQGDDLHCQFEVSFAQAALGGPVRIPTLRGFRTLHLPRGTESGSIFRFPGEGVPRRGHQPSGDQVVAVVVSTPRSLTGAQRAILTELARLEQEEREAAAHE
ncbi:MAG: molecular chaperone DnaJ [Deltaproteobacteria bacterium]|nr:molecular chaperone DnaJ [Deltaproteobacteria bacterium]